MVQKQDRERVRTLLKDTITLLCKNGLEFKAKFNLEALIGVTIDDDDVFLISINELVKSDSYVSPQPSEGDEQVAEDSDSGGTRRRRKRRRSRGIKIKVESGGGSDQEDTAQFNESEEDNDDDSSRFDETEPKRPKAEPKSDIIIIKEEIEDNWLQSTSQVDFSQFQNTSLDSSSGGGGMSQSTTASWLPPSSSQAQYSPGSLSMTQPVGSMVGMSPGQGFPVQQQSGQQQLCSHSPASKRTDAKSSRQAKWRERLRQNPDAYKKYLRKDSERKKKQYKSIKQRSDDQKQMLRLQWAEQKRKQRRKTEDYKGSVESHSNLHNKIDQNIHPSEEEKEGIKIEPYSAD